MDVYDYLVLPLLIFLARVSDVSIGTLRIIFVTRGNRLVAPLLGFFEILIWLLAVTRIIQNLDNWVCYVAYAGGFAMGNYVGLIIEDRLAVGEVVIRIITQCNHKELMARLNASGFGTTAIKGEGSKTEVNIIYSIVKRNNTNDVFDIIHDSSPGAFCTVEDIRLAKHNIIPLMQNGRRRNWLFRRGRKGK